MWKIERRSSGIPSIAGRDRHRRESRRGGYQGIASLTIVALRGAERSRFSRPWMRSARAPGSRASRCGPQPLTDDGRDRRVPIDLPQLDLPAGDQAEEQDQGGILRREGALRLHAPAEFLIEPFDHVRGAQRLPLRLREGEEGQQLRAALVQAAPDAGTALRPLAFEGRVRRAARVGGRRIDDAMKVLAELIERVLGRLALEVAQLVDRAA